MLYFSQCWHLRPCFASLSCHHCFIPIEHYHITLTESCRIFFVCSPIQRLLHRCSRLFLLEETMPGFWCRTCGGKLRKAQTSTGRMRYTIIHIHVYVRVRDAILYAYALSSVQSTHVIKLFHRNYQQMHRTAVCVTRLRALLLFCLDGCIYLIGLQQSHAIHHQLLFL